jgi:hypothetical protein
MSAVATAMGSHSSTTDVWVAFLQRRTGALGSDAPKELKIASWRAVNDDWDFCSETKFRATVISTMLPEEMFGGRRMEGNSIYEGRQFVSQTERWQVGLEQTGKRTSLLSCVSRTATPASTLPTVNEISIVFGW